MQSALFSDILNSLRVWYSMDPSLFLDLRLKDQSNSVYKNFYFKVGSIDLRATPIRTFMSKTVLQILSWIIPDVPIGWPNMSVITRDKTALAMLEKDALRWTGGCKVGYKMVDISLSWSECQI